VVSADVSTSRKGLVETISVVGAAGGGSVVGVTVIMARIVSQNESRRSHEAAEKLAI